MIIRLRSRDGLERISVDDKATLSQLKQQVGAHRADGRAVGAAFLAPASLRRAQELADLTRAGTEELGFRV
jgi:hypothetical protein